MLDMTIPCKDCICLPVCKARYMNHLKVAEKRPVIKSNMPTSVREALERHCQILLRYTVNPNGYIRLKNVTEFHHFMQGIDPPKIRNQYK